MDNFFVTAVWIFAATVTLHMIEELIWLPAWSVDAGRWHAPVGRREFGFATLVMLLFLYMAAFLANQYQPVGVYLSAGLALVMIVNLFIPHLGATFSQKRYAPGLATSLFLVVPSAVLLLWQSVTLQLIVFPAFIVFGIGYLIVVAVIWPFLFRIGRRVLL